METTSQYDRSFARVQNGPRHSLNQARVCGMAKQNGHSFLGFMDSMHKIGTNVVILTMLLSLRSLNITQPRIDKVSTIIKREYDWTSNPLLDKDQAHKDWRINEKLMDEPDFNWEPHHLEQTLTSNSKTTEKLPPINKEENFLTVDDTDIGDVLALANTPNNEKEKASFSYATMPQNWDR